MGKLLHLIDDQRELIESLQSRLKNLELEIDYAIAKLHGLEAAEKAISDENQLLGNLTPGALRSIQENAPKLLDATGRRRRPITEDWRNVLQYIDKMGGAKMSQIAGAIKNIKAKNIGSQLRYYKMQGFVEYEQSTGRYSLTESGKIACGAQDRSAVVDREDFSDLV